MKRSSAARLVPPRLPTSSPTATACAGAARHCRSTSLAAPISLMFMSNPTTRRPTMNSPATTIPTNDLPHQLAHIGLHATAGSCDDFIARAAKGRWTARTMLEELARSEMLERGRRGLERRLAHSRLGRFRPLADFDWNWPKKIDRSIIERALTLDFIPEARNLILLGTNGLGKTMLTKNIAYTAVLAGYTVVFRTAPELLADL